MIPPDDSTATLAQLRERLRTFVRERDWEQFHTPKNLAMALAIEVGELMEHFQWLTADESSAVRLDKAKRASVGEELADVLCYTLAIANELQLDVATTFFDKMRKNEQKYPADVFRGRYGQDAQRPAQPAGE